MSLIFGDPFVFAVVAIPVPQWKSGSYTNGYLFYMVQKHLLGLDVVNSTLSAALPGLEDVCEFVGRQKVDLALNQMSAFDAYFEISSRTRGLGGYDDNDYSFLISTYSQTDVNQTIYLIKTNNDYDRILVGDGTRGTNIKEYRVPSGVTVETLKAAANHHW